MLLPKKYMCGSSYCCGLDRRAITNNTAWLAKNNPAQSHSCELFKAAAENQARLWPFRAVHRQPSDAYRQNKTLTAYVPLMQIPLDKNIHVKVNVNYDVN